MGVQGLNGLFDIAVFVISKFYCTKVKSRNISSPQSPLGELKALPQTPYLKPGFRQLVADVCISQWPSGASLFILATIFVQICLYCLNCTKFGQLILRKIIKIVATKSHILRL